MNGHIERRTSKTKGVRYTPVVFVDAEHGGPRTERHGTYSLRAEAVQKLTDVLGSYFTGTWHKPVDMTVSELYTRWRTVRMAEWTPNTERHHGYNWRHIRDTLGDEQVAGLTREQIANWQAQLLKDGCAPKSVMSYRGTLHAMYRWAVEMGLLTTNPVDAVQAPKVPRDRHDALTVAQMAGYIAAVRNTRLWPGLVLGAGAALRRGEFLALRWSDVDWQAGGVTVDPVRGNLTGMTAKTLRFGQPKTRESGGFVSVAPFAMQALAELKATRQANWQLTRRKWSDDALICCSSDGKPIVPDQFTNSLARFCQRHGLPHTHPHAFRHGVIEAMLAAGERVDVVQQIARHTQPSTTLGIYAHATRQAQAQAADRYGALWTQHKKGDDTDDEATTRHNSDTKSATIADMAAHRARKRPA